MWYTRQKILNYLSPGIRSGTCAIYILKQVVSQANDDTQVYIVDLKGISKPRELTSGKQGAPLNPVFNRQGDKIAWVELDLDGYESDRFVPLRSQIGPCLT